MTNESATETDATHRHVCAYCGNEYRQVWHAPNPDEPCPQCRSRKKRCSCA